MPSAPTPASSFAALWTLDPSIDYLNHGSYGACPRAVQQAQTELREQLEREPIQFFDRALEPLADAARGAVGHLVGADPDDLAFVTNATAGVNTVLASLALDPGDELLTTDQAYNACRNALEVVAQRAKARVVVASLPFPLRSLDELVEPILAAVTPRTRLALLDHVTSPTGLVLPIRRLVGELRARGVETLVDGAHAPGMVSLDLTSLGAAYYTANCHKWLCGPKGAAFLHVRRDRQPQIRPLVISHGANSTRRDRTRFRLEFDWMGTVDPTAALCLPAAIDFLNGLLPGGLPALQERNRSLALQARRMLCTALGIPAPSPDSAIGSLASVPLPDARLEAASHPKDPLQHRLFDTHRIEVPLFWWPAAPKRLLRISAQAYNRPDQYQRLAAVLPAALAEPLAAKLPAN